MLSDFLTNKWTLGGLGFLVIFAGLCYFWYQHTTASYREQAVGSDEIIRQSNKQHIPTTAKPTEPAADAPAVSTPSTVENLITGTHVTKDTEPTQAQTEVSTQTAENTDVPLSPNGFGPYPQNPKEMGVPKDKVKIFWENVSVNPRHELLFRVRIKLYQQGIKATGATYERNGLIYPIIKGIRYVEWDTVEYPDGTVERYVSRSTGHPDDNFMQGVEGRVLKSDIPGHLKIYTYPDGGIDPYEFLDLSKE